MYSLKQVRYDGKAFFLALQFLTRIPVIRQCEMDDICAGRSVLYYPLVGLIVGVLLVLGAVTLQTIAPPIQASVILAFWVYITGALHLDGLADCSDAWLGGMGDRERSLAIMKDPAAGPVAVVLLVTLLLLKWSAIGECLKSARYEILLLAPVAGRLSILALMLTTRYVREKGLAEKLVDFVPKKATILVLITGSLIVILCLGITVYLAGFLVFFWIRQIAKKRIGGVTGDVYGASVELVEVAVLTVAVG